jgi:transcriptional regulator with XRE-family HTH domain
MPTFGERLKFLRERAGLSQPQLAQRAGLPVGNIRNYEQSLRQPLWVAVFKLSDALGVPVEQWRDCIPRDEPAGKGKGAKRPAGRKGK